ncbi:hypothetical protein QGP82_24325 [Leptothoe sp. LEGE 181152]|nr:hypothetical protein [Leptothoe sp. LEGE 181152]
MRSIALLLLSVPLLLICTLQPEPTQPDPISSTPIADNPSDTLSADIQTQIRTDLANHLSIPSNRISIQHHSRQTWSDGCLGLGGPTELCLAAITEGWQVEAIDTETNETYIYRTNLNGDQIRRAP